MVKQVDLNLVFRTISDPTRRHILEHLSEAARPMTVLELAQPHDMSLPAVSKHLKYLEKAGLIERSVKGREHRFVIVQQPLKYAEAWLVYYLQCWNSQLDKIERNRERYGECGDSCGAIIRTIKPADAPALQRLSKQYLEPWFGSQAKAVYDWVRGSNNRTAWVAELDGKIVGFAIISDKPSNEYVKLSSLVVDASARYRGVGRLLMERCEEYAKQTQKYRLLALVSEDNGLGKNFFENRNFRLVGEINNKYRAGKAELIYEFVW